MYYEWMKNWEVRVNDCMNEGISEWYILGNLLIINYEEYYFYVDLLIFIN